MSLENAGQLADVLTSIFTILTLVYLALQIRANTATQRAESSRASRAANSEFLNHLVQNKDVAHMWRLGLQDVNTLDPDERIQFFSLFGLMLDAEMKRFTEHQLQIISEDEYAGNDQRNTFVDWLQNPGGLFFWKIYRKNCQRDFRDYIDDELKKREASRQVVEQEASDDDELQ